ncbi:MAG: patatin-like phospholipase family protein [Candidatus Omnitrophica bacterium]|nr:patatin-like phospholipase family protein [Candidatus Omnitrophota bacterium]
MKRQKILFLFLAVVVLVTASGCAHLRNAVPKDLTDSAEIAGMPDIRSYFDDPNPLVERSLLEAIKEEPKGEYPLNAEGIKIYPMLALSGGAANGAYGVGLLKGWSEEGSRPVFKAVTGVSTGAIIAVLAFRGKDYDNELEKLYTTVSTKDIMKEKGLFSAVFGDSLASSKPLGRYIASFVDEKLLKRVAEEHRRGRRLFVGTVNLDAQKFVIWDMGALACKGGPAAEELFQKVLLASASIPVTFPPVYFKVEADGKVYDEMHVDGGTMTQVFYLYGFLKNMEAMAKAAHVNPSKFRPDLYVIRNGYVSANWEQVRDNLASISSRAIDTFVDSQAVGDLYRLYVFTKRRGGTFNLAYIPPDFKPKAKELFDMAEMRRLFLRGYHDGLNGYQWHKTPPGLKESSDAQDWSTK